MYKDYTDFSLGNALRVFHLAITQNALFPNMQPQEVPAWLRATLDRGLPLALNSEKARSEYIVAPILLALRELSGNRFAIYSGERMDVDAELGLVGECDFILALTPPLPVIQSPIACLVEAKKNDIESGLGQCVAQMIGAQRLNLLDNTGIDTIFGCVTTGETWQFLRLTESVLTIDSARYYIVELEKILGALLAVVNQFDAVRAAATV